MALATNALTQLDTVNAELGLTTGSDTDRDDRIERYINVASDLFEKLTNRRWYWATRHTEKVPGYGTPRLTVSDHLPIDTINAIDFDDGFTVSTVDSDLYEIEQADKGWIRHTSGTWEDTARTRTEITTESVSKTDEYLYEVDYDGGYVTPEQDENDANLTRDLPYDIEDAAIEYAVMRYERSGSRQDVASISMDDGSIDYVTVDGHRIAVPPSFDAAVASYRRVALA